MTPPTIGVLAMQGAFREHIGVLQELGAEAIPFRAASQLDEVDGLVLPGGESTTMDKLIRKFGLQQPMRDSIAAGLPVMATCAGVILLATHVRDGLPDQESLEILPITVRRNAYGRQPESFEADVDVDFLSSTFRGVFIRAPLIEEIAEGVEVHAAIDGNPVVVGHGHVLALTFHPELTHDDRVHRRFVEMVSATMSSAPSERSEGSEAVR
jgi:5'-phosphate synthase pdxT subunit